MPRGNRRVYDLSENVVPAQGAEALVDTPASEAPTDTTSGERSEQQTDTTSLDSNPFDEAGTRKPDHRVDVTTLAKRRQQAKSLIPPKLTNNEFSNILQRIDRLSTTNPSASFDRVVVAGVKDYCYRANRNELNVLAAVLPILIRSGNFDLKDRDVLIGLNSRVSNLRRQADDPSGVASQQMTGPDQGGGVPSGNPMSGGLSGPSNDAGDSAAGGIMGDLGSGLGTALGEGANTMSDPSATGGDVAQGLGQAADTAGGAIGDAASQIGGMASDALGLGGSPSGQPDASQPQQGDNSMLGDIGSGIGSLFGDGGAETGASIGNGIQQGIDDGYAQKAQQNPLAASVAKNRRRASYISKLILAGKGRYDQLSAQDQHLVTAWVHHAADYDGDDVTNDVYRREASAGSYKERAKARAQARQAARVILSGKATFAQLNERGKFLVRAWVKSADDDGDNGPSKTPGAGDSDSWNGVPGTDENDKDNRQDPHGDGGADDGMLSDNGDGGQYGEVSTDATPGQGPVDRSPNQKDSRRRAAKRKESALPPWMDKDGNDIEDDDEQKKRNKAFDDALDSDDSDSGPGSKKWEEQKMSRRENPFVRRADDNMDVAQKDTDSVDVEAPVEWTTERGESSQFDRGEYDQNGPILGEGGAPQPDKSTDQNWPPKASAVDSIRLADMYVDLGLIPANKKYEVVAGFEGMSSIIVKDRLRVLAVVQDRIAESRKANRNRSMVPQSEKNASNSRMPTMGRGSSIKNNGHNDGLAHFLAL